VLAQWPPAQEHLDIGAQFVLHVVGQGEQFPSRLGLGAQALLRVWFLADPASGQHLLPVQPRRQLEVWPEERAWHPGCPTRGLRQSLTTRSAGTERDAPAGPTSLTPPRRGLSG
jgi:hypothetical protein